MQFTNTPIHKYKFVFFSDCVQRRADSIPNAMVGGERGDTLEGAFKSFLFSFETIKRAAFGGDTLEGAFKSFLFSLETIKRAAVPKLFSSANSTIYNYDNNLMLLPLNISMKRNSKCNCCDGKTATK